MDNASGKTRLGVLGGCLRRGEACLRPEGLNLRAITRIAPTHTNANCCKIPVNGGSGREALLQHYLAQEQQRPVSTKSIQRTLARLRIVWKRPRHHLALQDPYWRQVKGGLNAASGCGPTPSF